MHVFFHRTGRWADTVAALLPIPRQGIIGKMNMQQNLSTE